MEVVLNSGMHNNERVGVLEPSGEPQDSEEEVEKLVFLNVFDVYLLDLGHYIWGNLSFGVNSNHANHPDDHADKSAHEEK